MAIEIISTLKPKNNGTFPIAEAKDITVDENGTRLDTKLTELANNAGSGGTGGGGSSGGNGIEEKTFSTLEELAHYIAANPSLTFLKAQMGDGGKFSVTANGSEYTCATLTAVDVMASDGGAGVNFLTVEMQRIVAVVIMVFDGETFIKSGKVNLLDGEGEKSGTFTDMTEGTITALFKTDSGSGGSSGGGIIDVAELPTEGIDTAALYRKPVGWLIYNNYINFADVYMVDTRPTTGEICTTDGQSINAVYYEVSTGEMIGYVNATVGTALGVPAGWYTAQQLMPALGQAYGGVIANITEATASNTFYLLLEYKTYYYKNRWFCTSKEIVKIKLNDDSTVQLTDADYAKIQNDYQNIELIMSDANDAYLFQMFLSYRKGHEVVFSSVPYVCDVEIAPVCSIIVNTKDKTCVYHAKLLTTTMYS